MATLGERPWLIELSANDGASWQPAIGPPSYSRAPHLRGALETARMLAADDAEHLYRIRHCRTGRAHIVAGLRRRPRKHKRPRPTFGARRPV